MPLMRRVTLVSLLVWGTFAYAIEPFVIDQVRVEGLQRISVGTVYNYLPLKAGNVLDDAASDAAIHALFKTGFFHDVVLERDGDTLIVFVEERPAIASIDIKGNSDIPSDQLTENLKRIGFSEGRVFDRSMLDKVEQELKQQYLAMGKYNAQVRSTVTPQERNRVAINIEIAEGEVASIHHLNIIGNTVFTEEELRSDFQLGTDGGWFSSSDQYSRQKLSADLETLRAHYMDNGYINFDILSTQVAITPDKKHVYITINVDEGEKYTISDVAIQGDTVVPREQLEKLISIKPGDTFSRLQVTESNKRISDALGNIGYAFANINPVPDVDKEEREVSLTYFVDPGKQVYVRRINLSGNVRTDDEVLRREMRQMEGGWISTSKVERSRTRLNRLGYFDEVSVSTPAVPGSPDLVDVNYDVMEQMSFGSFNFGIGYGDVDGLLLNASVDWNNFMGTGQRFSIAFDNSDVSRTYSFNFVDPYWTIDGVSRSISMYYRKTDADEADTSDYTKDSYGASLSFGVPVSEYDTVRYGARYENTKLNVNEDTSVEILDFCRENSDGVDDCQFDTYSVELGWTHDTRNRSIFPDKGGRLSLSGEAALPMGDSSMSFYKLRLNKQHYVPLFKHLTLAFDGEVSYADVYGDSKTLPPYERYFAGGIRTVRGYSTNSLTSTENTIDSFGDPLGGNARLLGNLELIFPPPWDLESKSMRLMAFVDAGNVYDTYDGVDVDELRYSAGFSLSWLTPVGPLTFSVAQAMNDKPGDETESFQFTLGTP
ncbi:MAG: outer membrane protein assembly factor BamA [Gammaproteobacteria bacterium]|nr:outer membrane protein assembly factor BamA [Gammaproteobacteria bacterium]MCW9088831.1 outer membrane protein assembly factor BamA [Gammaproteobacteria bacterium]